MTQINKVYNSPRTAVDSDIYVVGSIEAPENYLDEFQTLREAKSQENIRIIINSGGGNLDTAVQFINCMRDSSANIISSIEGMCHSAATLMFLTADQWSVSPNCLMLVHNYSGGAYGKGNEIKQSVVATDDWVKGVMRDTYKGFLTEEEMEKLFLNQDFWFDSAEIERRLLNVIALREKMVDEEEEAHKLSLISQLEILRETMATKEEEEESFDEGQDIEGVPSSTEEL